MNKIICDVCGTAYPETATQCPICGCVHSADAKAVVPEAEEATSSYTYVKGGRFSKSNVRKRNRAAAQTAADEEEQTPEPAADAPKEGKKNNTPLVITAVVLMLAIVAVVIYIALKFFLPALPATTENSDTGSGTTGATELVIPCQEISLDVNQIVMDGVVGSARMIYATVTPADTTDDITYTSSDEAVVTVSQIGKITVVGSGEAVITVTCGSASARCTVICTDEGSAEETTVDTTEDTTEDTTADTTEDSTAADTTLRLNRSDITFTKKGDSWMIYSGSVAKTNITWSSDDESVATIENGTVKAVGAGTTKVHAEYNGEKASCIIRCAFSDTAANQGVSGTGGVTEDGGSGTVTEDGGTGSITEDGGSTSIALTLNYSDVTLSLSTPGANSFTLILADGNTPVSVTWTVENSAVCSVSDNVVTGVSVGMTTVTATYNGQTYSCIVRVKA